MPKTILIVDDKKLLRDSLVDYLGEDKYHFIEAETGEKALEMFRAETCDLVILDNMLPGINGIKVLQLMKKIKRDIPVIGLTGELDVEIREEYLRAGGYDVLAKSSIYEKLVPTVEAALKGEAPHKIDFDGLDFDKTAEALKQDGRWEEAALYLREAGLEQEALSNTAKMADYFKAAIEMYDRAGRHSKASELRDQLENLNG